jgi:hypothetical protein
MSLIKTPKHEPEVYWISQQCALFHMLLKSIDAPFIFQFYQSPSISQVQPHHLTKFTLHLNVPSKSTAMSSKLVLAPAGAGALFGAALTASRVYLPTVIIQQMQLQDFHMLKVFLTACATSA